MSEPAVRPHGGRHHHARERVPNVVEWDTLREQQAWDLERKVVYAHERIRSALEVMKAPCLAFSAGKDSTVLLHMLRQHRPEIPVIYGNTTIEFPECVKFARQLAKDWTLNYHEAKPDVTFWWVVEQYGWPVLGKTFGVGGVAHKSSRAAFFEERIGEPSLEEFAEFIGRDRAYAIQQEVPISSACCTYLKERPSQKVQRALGVDGVFLGILAGESRRRTFNHLQYGDLYRTTSGERKCHPMSIWTDQDVWAYIRRFDVPYAPLYDMGYTEEKTGRWVSHRRNGCMFCAMDLAFPDNHLAVMRRTHPAAWRTLVVHKGFGKVLLQLRLAMDNHQLDMFEQGMGLEAYLDRFPCAFDRV